MLSLLAITISLYQFSLLFNAIGEIIPTRHLLGSFMCLQFFAGPVLAYNGFDAYQYPLYRMKIDELTYFQYAIPAVILFIIGLHLKAGDNRGENLNIEQIKLFYKKERYLPFALILLGLGSGFVATYFSTDLAFIFYLLSSAKFIGLFILIIGIDKIQLIPSIVVIGSIISSSFGSGMFHDLVTWSIYIISVLGIKYRFSFWVKCSGLLVFIFLMAVIQILKADYRIATSLENKEANVETFYELYQKENQSKGVLSFENLAASCVRINQGFIITNIMTNVPAKVPFSKGSELYLLLESAILPRFLAPNKLNAGDRTLFTKYSGIPLKQGTSMGLSSLGDAYINFGILGGSLFMLGLGLLYSFILNSFGKYSVSFPVLTFFTSLAFYYPIRPDCELQTILGHLFKSCFLIFIVIQIWKSKFKSIHS